MSAVLSLLLRQADVDAVRAEADQLFREAQELSRQRRFAEAAVKFDASMRKLPRATTIFNVGRCAEELKQVARAIGAYRWYLLLAPGATDKDETQATIRELEQLLVKRQMQAVTIFVTPPGAEVVVDGAVVGTSGASVEVTPGRHIIAARSEGYTPTELVVSVPRLESQEVNLSLVRAAPVAEAPPVEQRRVLSRPPLEAAPAAVALEPELPRDAVFVHIDSDNTEARLLRFGGTRTEQGTSYGPKGPQSTTRTVVDYVDECRAPCDEPVFRASERFYIGGTEVSYSKEFVLIDQARNGRVDIAVKAGNSSAQFWGLFGFATGLTAVALGVVFGLIGALTPVHLSGGLVIGGVASGVGGALLALISYFPWRNNDTVVTFPNSPRARGN